MIRRKFFILISIFGIGGAGLVLSSIFSKAKIKNLAESVFNFAKPVVDLPPQGELISVETALNSRCNSDSDENTEKFHWGMFNRTKKLSFEQIIKVLNSASIPRFTSNKVEIEVKGNIFTFKVQKEKFHIINEHIMIESGMQQQAVGLMCAALGIGMVFNNLGVDGTPLSDTEFGTMKIKLGAMKPSYNGLWWTSLPPFGSAPWEKGNLPDPIREGSNSLISTLSDLQTQNKGNSILSESAIAQLLWAARGRTPHFYLSNPWGMTIPTWQGKQGISSLYLYRENKLYRYINWADNKPTHSIKEINRADEKRSKNIGELFPANNALIILGANEKSARSLWEIGYQLLNLMLQAKTLDIDYSAIILDETQRSIVDISGVNSPVAILAV